MAEALTFDTGLREFKINDKAVYFNPTDANFIERLYSAMESIERIDSEYGEKITGTEDNAEAFDLSRERDTAIREEINSVFDDDVCTPWVGNVSMTAYVNGLPIWLNILFLVIDRIDETYTEEQKKTNPRLAKYTAKYERKRKK